MKSRIIAVAIIFGLFIVLVGCQSTYVRSAKIYLQQNDAENAKKVLNEGAAVTPEDPELWYMLGKVNVDLRAWSEMNVAFEKAQSLTDVHDKDIEATRFEAWRVVFNSAVKHFNGGKYEETIEKLQVALKIKQNDFETLKRIGLSYLQLEKLDSAEEYLNQSIVQDTEGKDVSLRINLQLLYWRQERWDDVIRLADEILAMPDTLVDDSMRMDVIQKKALAFQKKDDRESAIAAWDEAITTMPDNADLYYNKAILLHGMEKFEEASKSYLKALEINPDDDEARMNVARALLAQQQWETLVEVLEPMLFPGGNIKEYDPEIREEDPWLILRAAYENIGQKSKSAVINKILKKIQKG